jgi:hypothetical protein
MTGDEKLKLATAVSAKATIADLRLWACHCRYGDIAPPQLPKSIHQLTIRTTVGFSRDGADLKYLIQFHLEPAMSVPFFHIEATYAGLFKIDDPKKISDEQAGAFGEMAVVHMIWPFFREYVHSTAARMALPSILLPLRQIAAPGGNAQQPRIAGKRIKKAKRSKRTSK